RGLRGVHLRVATYIAGGDGLDFRSDLGTLNLSNVPTVMVELGNMRNPRDAKRMSSPAGRATYARGLAHAVRHFLESPLGLCRLAGAGAVGPHPRLHPTALVGAPPAAAGRVHEDPGALLVATGA